MNDDILSACRLDMRKHYAPPSPLLEIDGTPILTRGNISAIVGAPKSRKTFLATMIAAAFLNGKLYEFSSPEKSPSVLWIDTEQARVHAARVYARVNALCGYCEDADRPNFVYLMFRDFPSSQRFDLVSQAMERHTPTLVILDGVADLVDSNNDEAQATKLQDFLMSTSKRMNCHILCVIHSNHGSEKARGHTGSNLTRKCETIMNVYPAATASKVWFVTRDETPEPFAFSVDEDSLPCIAEIPHRRVPKNEEIIENVLLPKEECSYSELMNRIHEYREKVESPCSLSTAKRHIKEMLQQELVKCNNLRYRRILKKKK